tara:strand:- start:479 stop:1270 length:792 start_codon:yes stop_codon:yes gene_type:complete
MNTEAQKIVSLVKEAVALSKKDGDLNKAVAEISKKADLNPEEINRMVELTNTVQQLHLFKTSEDKTSEFEVADPKIVKELIYGEEVRKEASSRDEFSSLSKVASTSYSGKVKGTYSDYPVDRNELVKEAYDNIKRLDLLLEEVMDSKNSAENEYFSSIIKLAEDLDKHTSEKFSEFEINATNSLGEVAAPYLDALEKLAKVNNKRALNIPDKNVIKNSNNLSLLKAAVANKMLYSSMEEAESKIREVRSSWDRRLGEYGRKSM